MGITIPSRTTIEPEEVHEILRNRRRRRVIEHLGEHYEPVSLRDLSERIAEFESGESPAPRDLRESVYNSLRQTHLPKLDDKGIIEYDEDRKTVKLEESASDVQVYMEVVNRYGMSWADYYRTLGVVALCLVVTSGANVAVFSAIPPLAWATVFLAVFAGSAAFQLWSRRWFYLKQLLSRRGGR
jgi:DNA-binding transcriptional ArsR family regulator